MKDSPSRPDHAGQPARWTPGDRYDLDPPFRGLVERISQEIVFNEVKLSDLVEAFQVAQQRIPHVAKTEQPESETRPFNLNKLPTDIPSVEKPPE